VPHTAQDEEPSTSKVQVLLPHTGDIRGQAGLQRPFCHLAPLVILLSELVEEVDQALLPQVLGGVNGLFSLLLHRFAIE